MKTLDEWALDLDKMYEVSHPHAERFVRNVVKTIYSDIIDLIENEHPYDDGLCDMVRDRMLEVTGEEE